VEGQGIGDLLGPEGAGVFLFVEQSDPPHPKAVVVKKELLGVIDGVSDLDPLADIGGGDLVERPPEADRGIMIDHPFVADKEDLIKLGSRESPDQYPAQRGIVAVDGSLRDPGVEFMVVVVCEPKREGLVELLEGDLALHTRDEPFADGPKQTFDLSAGGAVVGFGVDEGDPGPGTASGQKIGGETGTVIDIEAFGDAVGEKGLLEDS